MQEPTKAGASIYRIQVLQHGKYWENAFYPDQESIMKVLDAFSEMKQKTDIPMRVVQVSFSVIACSETEEIKS